MQVASEIHNYIYIYIYVHWWSYLNLIRVGFLGEAIFKLSHVHIPYVNCINNLNTNDSNNYK